MSTWFVEWLENELTIRDLAARWEREGLLTTPASITDPRRVTSELAELAGCERWLFPDDTPDTH